ncbi:Mannose-binding protein C [Orchesella cincta]|uniref:Mannose-binding protein C n=1 Tax=Orchesella cincta TaxID=48709 RepID=A0A1D2MCA4_ORCCI|nr:Mannose-binding protein C [Orchesella cincta]
MKLKDKDDNHFLVIAHNSKDDAAFELEKNQTHSLKGLKTGGSLSATNFLKISGFKPLATKLPKKVISSKALSGLSKSPKSGRKFSTGEASKKLKHPVHDDGSSETRRKSTASKKLPFGRSLIGTDDDDDQETNPARSLFGASLLINPKKPKPIELENGMGGRSLSEVGVNMTPSQKVVIQDDIDESAEEATTTASQTKGAGGIFAGSMIAPKESENIPEGRAFTDESEDERIEGDSSNEQKVPNSEKWKSVNPETLPENVHSTDYDVTTIVPHSHKKFDNFPAHLSVLEMTQTDELFSCDDKRGTLSPIANNSKFFADPRLLYTYEEAKKLCMQKELVLAELMDWPDHWSIQSYVVGNNAFYIGPNDIRKEGVFKRSDNGKAITFQNYHTSQPDDRNMSEDCTTVSRERKGGPVGSSDDDCFKSFHVLCMFPAYSKCFNNSKEAIAIFHMERNYSLNLVVNASERAYFVSNFQLSWANAHDYCRNHSMALYNMDAVTNMGFFRAMVRWETKLLEGIPAPPLQYWTSGKFKKTHMNAEIYWYHKPYLTESEERVLAKTSNFTFSGVFKWSDKKKKDAGAPYIWRKDLCLSFAFEASPEPTPFVRNTNCDMPGYFVCMEDYDIDGYPADSK